MALISYGPLTIQLNAFQSIHLSLHFFSPPKKGFDNTLFQGFDNITKISIRTKTKGICCSLVLGPSFMGVSSLHNFISGYIRIRGFDCL